MCTEIDLCRGGTKHRCTVDFNREGSVSSFAGFRRENKIGDEAHISWQVMYILQAAVALVDASRCRNLLKAEKRVDESCIGDDQFLRTQQKNA